MAPDPEDRTLETGQPYGNAGKQAAFVAQTAAAPGPAYQMQTPRQEVMPPYQPIEEAPQEQIPMQLGDGTEMDLGEVLFAPSERPSEHVLTGIDRTRQVSKVLERVEASGYGTPGVQALRALANAYDL